MPLFRKRPMTVEAMQFNEAGDNANEVIHWAIGHIVDNVFDQNRQIFVQQIPVPGNEDSVFHAVATRTLDGELLYAEPGDWIIKGRDDQEGAFFIADPDTFDKVYEPLVLQ